MKLIFFVICFIIFSAPLSSHALCVKSSVANMRGGPGTQHEILWQVGRYMPFEKIGSSLNGGWYAVQDVDGDVFWIHKSLLTAAYSCAVVKAEVVNMRKGPGTKYGKVFSEPAKQYDSFRIIRRQGSWMKVKDEWNNIGWIHRNYLWIR